MSANPDTRTLWAFLRRKEPRPLLEESLLTLLLLSVILLGGTVCFVLAYGREIGGGGETNMLRLAVICAALPLLLTICAVWLYLRRFNRAVIEGEALQGRIIEQKRWHTHTRARRLICRMTVQLPDGSTVRTPKYYAIPEHVYECRVWRRKGRCYFSGFRGGFR